MTDRARHVLSLAEQEARRRGATGVEPEHILLGLAREGAGVAAHVLKSLGISAERLADALPAGTGAARDEEPAPQWSAPAERSIARARSEAALLNHNYAGTEHLILGVVLSGEGAVPQILAALGVSAEEIRQEVYSILGHDRPGHHGH